MFGSFHIGPTTQKNSNNNTNVCNGLEFMPKSDILSVVDIITGEHQTQYWAWPWLAYRGVELAELALLIAIDVMLSCAKYKSPRWLVNDVLSSGCRAGPRRNPMWWWWPSITWNGKGGDGWEGLDLGEFSLFYSSSSMNSICVMYSGCRWSRAWMHFWSLACQDKARTNVVIIRKDAR